MTRVRPRSADGAVPASPATNASLAGLTSDGRRKESPYLTWVKQLPSGGVNLAGSAGPPCPASALGPFDADAPLNERSDYGWPPLVEQIASRYRVSESSVVVAAGTSMANHLAIATVLEPGDHVLVERPGYDPLALVPALWGATVDSFPRRAEESYRLDVDAVEAALTPRTRLVILSDLHNPTGAHLAAEDLRALAALADARGIHVLVDEVYREWLQEDPLPSTIHASERVIATSSLTKVWGLGGLRVGWILAEPALADRMRRFAGLFDNVIAHPSERLAVRALARSASIIGAHQDLLARNRQLMARWVGAMASIRWTAPGAGATAFVDLGIGDVWSFVDRLAREQDTLIVPGYFFGDPHSVRIALGVDSALLEHGLTRMAALLADERSLGG